MAHSEARASEVWYDVFLSFCGADTGDGFTGSLHEALKGSKIKVFGAKKEINETILRAIDKSKIYIPIIPQIDLDRKWCLIKLERMLTNVSRPKDKKRIFPIFYKVKPKDVEHRTPHKENPPSEVELTAFKGALAKVGRIEGWNVEDRQSLQKNNFNLVVQKVMEELGRRGPSQSGHSIDDLTQSLHDLSNHTIKWCPGRGSPSRATTEIGRMLVVRMQDGSIGKGEIKGITSITTVEGLRMKCSEEREE